MFVRRLTAVLAAVVASMGAVAGLATPAAEAAVVTIPCYVSGPSVFGASPGVIGARVSVRCPPAARVSVRLQWLRNGVPVSTNWGGGFGFVSTQTGARCYRGATYQPVAYVTASMPGAVSAARTVFGPPGRFCG